jgi:RNA polymerase sigma-70 factor, ECF subfamily
MLSLYQNSCDHDQLAGMQQTEEHADLTTYRRSAGLAKSPASSHERLKCRVREAPHLSDEELVMLVRGGDTGAFGDLIQRHLASCFKRAFCMLRNRSDAEDEVQNTFSKAFESLSRFRFEGPFSAWLGRILQNQCRMAMRSRRSGTFVYVDAITDSNARLELVDQVPDQEDELGTQQIDDLLKDQISRVPQLMRCVLLLRDVEGLPMAEVAVRLGLTLPAAKSRLMRARQEMRARLTKHCGQAGRRTLAPKPAQNRVEYTYVP